MRENTLFEAGLGACVFGAISGAFLPTVPVLATGSYIIGGSSILLHLISQTNTNWKKLFKAKKIYTVDNNKEKYPVLVEKTKAEYGELIQFRNPPGISSEDYKKSQQAIEEFLNARVEISYHNKYTFIKLYKQILQTQYPFKKVQTNGLLELVLGYSYKGLEKIDLGIGEPHILIAGETGSGKSTLLRSILANLILNNASDKLQLYLIDMKEGVELGLFRKCSIVKDFCSNIDQAEKLLYKILSEVKKRYKLFYHSDCTDIKEYNKKHKKNPLNYRLLVIDEFSLLSNQKNSIKVIEKLAAIARACGIHMILCTQRPSSKIITGEIKANISTIVGMKCLNNLNSRIIIDESGLENLRGHGHGLLRHHGKITEIQAMNISPRKARDLMKPFYRKENKIVKFRSEKLEKRTSSGEVDNFDFLNNL